MNFPLLQQTPVFESFSDVGKRIFHPNGIFYWANRAKTEGEYNATIGSAFGIETDMIPTGRDKKIVYSMPGLQKYLNIEPERVASYAPVAGVSAFRDLWEAWVIKKGEMARNMPYPPILLHDLITKPQICNGITNAIFLTTRMFLNPGESIVCPNKRWGNYDAVLKYQNGLKLSLFDFFKGKEFNLSGMIEAIEKCAKIQDKIVLILNFPNNPTGYCPTTLEARNIVESLVDACERLQKPIIILCDDAYEGFVFNNAVISNSLFYMLVNRHHLLIPIKLDGASKEMLMYGGRIACITLGIHSSWIKPEELPAFRKEWENKLQGMIRSTISNSNHFIQEILVEYLKDGFVKLLEDQNKIHELLKIRYEETIRAFNAFSHPNISIDPAAGGFFVFLNLNGVSATTFADHLVVKYKVGTFPNENLEEKVNGIRFAFCSVAANQIEECFKRIFQAMNDFFPISS
ncbi:MAG: aminotransferase class I/II-fold pyridoxal phosphate-dependent enzyme [Candidatus Lokiarchaeota archaeon]|nr:aminotransferase class I/II-fold pyridoxal phosphate-dependent enzyme [Candidatus Harpocratesius repetitus]